MQLNKNQAGLTLGLISALGHLLCVIAVAIGIGQALLDWTLSYHFISVAKTVVSSSLGLAIVGIISAFICGYIVGWVFAFIWNKVGKKNPVM